MGGLFIKPEKNESAPNSTPTSSEPNPHARAKHLLKERAPREKRKAEARRRVGITSEIERKFVSIHHIIEGVGQEKCLSALRCDDSPEAIAFIQKYDSISSSDLEYVSIEEIALIVGINARKLAETITGALLMTTMEASKVIALAAQPLILNTTIKQAQHPLGEKDREMFLRGVGFLPTPKGSNTTINLNQLNQGSQSQSESAPKAPLTLDSMDEMLLDMQSVVRNPDKQLTAGNEHEPTNNTVPENAPAIEYIEADVL